MPARYKRNREGAARWSIWSRVNDLYPGYLVQHGDGTWEELVNLPETEGGPWKYLFGATGFNNTTGITYDVPLRLYCASPVYIIGDTLKAELVAAVTVPEPGGYGAYISAAPGGAKYTGDEIIASGRHPTYEQAGSTAGKGL